MLNSVNITINKKVYKLQLGIKAFIEFQKDTLELLGESLNYFDLPETFLKDINNRMILIYSSLKAYNKDFEYNYDEFLEVLENDIQILVKMTELQLKNNKEELLIKDNGKGKKKSWWKFLRR
jgi:hypothetical protein